MGVHIADVAHFVMEGNELDSWASHRATSVYLVHKVLILINVLILKLHFRWYPCCQEFFVKNSVL